MCNGKDELQTAAVKQQMTEENLELKKLYLLLGDALKDNNK